MNKLSVEAQINLERKYLGMNGSSQNVYLTKLIRCDKMERLSQRRERTENEFTICLLDKISDMWYNKEVTANDCNLKSILKIEQWAKKESVELHLQERPLGAEEIQYYREIPNKEELSFWKKSNLRARKFVKSEGNKYFVYSI